MDGDQASGGFTEAVSWRRLRRPCKAVIDAGDLSGFVTLVWRKGEIAQVLTPSAGATSRPGLPMTRDTLFRIASMTKPVTSIAALMLLEEGQASSWKIPSPNGCRSSPAWWS